MSRLKLSHCVIDLDQERVQRDGATIKLTSREARLLRYMSERAGELVTREELLVNVWEYSPTVVTRAVDSTLVRLRRKVEADPREPVHLQTVFGEGYRLQLRRGKPPTNSRLPAEVDPFIGRARELDQLRSLIDDGARLITLVGPAGSGKSRLALHLARELEPGLDGPALFCSLESATLPFQVSLGLAAALGMSVGTMAVEQVGLEMRHLGRTLVVLDNLEQALGALPSTLGRWLEASPDALFVATSRERLGLKGEHVIEVAGLAPEDALALWQARVRAVQPDYVLADADRAQCREVCAALDDLPLALEMAAARMDVLDLDALAGLLDQRFKLLVQVHTAPARQVSMEAALDWSWELLDEWECQAMAQLTVFQGGFDADAAQGVLDLDEDAPWTPDVLRRLSGRSLLHRTVTPSAVRFELYRSVHAYVVQRRPETAASARHRRWFARWGDPAWCRALRLAPEQALADLENLQTALEDALASDDTRAALHLALAIQAVVGAVGPYSLGLKRLRCVEGLTGLSADDHITLALALAEAEAGLEAFDAAITRLEALGSPRRRGDELRVARTALALRRDTTLPDSEVLDPPLAAGSPWSPHLLALRGRLCVRKGDDAGAREAFEGALMAIDPERDSDLALAVHAELACVLARTDRAGRARTHLAEAAQALESTGDRALAGRIAHRLGLAEHALGRVDVARAHFEAARRGLEQLGELRCVGRVCSDMAWLALDQDQVDQGVALSRAGVDLATRRQDPQGLAQARVVLARALVRRGEHAEAERALTQVRRVLTGPQPVAVMARIASLSD